MPLVATQISRLTMDTDRPISIGSIRVHNILVSNPTSSEVTMVFLDNNDIPLLNMTVPGNDSRDFRGIWIADNGLIAQSANEGSIVVTVIHSAAGA